MKSKTTETAKKKEFKMQARKKKPGQSFFTPPLGLIDWQPVLVTIEKGNAKYWKNQTAVVKAPAGWSEVFAFIGGWELHYTLPDHELAVAGVFVDITETADDAITLNVKARLGDKNFNDPWGGVFRCEVLFFGPL